MAHTARDKDKLLNRTRRIRGQVEAIERALTEGRDCGEIMHLLAACRGAVSSLTAEVIEGHVRDHILDPADRSKRDSKRAEAAQELIDVLKTYVR